MILHMPEKVIKNGAVVVSSKFEMKQQLDFLPDALWFKFPEKYEKMINNRADGFLPTAILMAMYVGEDLAVHGEVSSRLAYNMNEFRNIFHSWYPDLFKNIEITYEKIAATEFMNVHGAVATAFSGGVDSFYSLWSHLPDNQQILDAQVTHGLFVHGLDMRLDDEESYFGVAEKYSNLFSKLKLELIPAATNAFQFSEFRIDWMIFHGAPLIGAALLLAPWLKRFYIPATGGDAYFGLVPNGTSPMTDHLASTDGIEMVHHGAFLNRYEKLAAISMWEVTYDALRVCSQKRSSKKIQNCCSCHKCYRTMASMQIQGIQNNYQTFHRPINILDFLRWGSFFPVYSTIDAELSRIAFSKGKIWIGLGIWIALLISIFRKTFVLIIKKILGRRLVYYLKRRVFSPEAI